MADNCDAIIERFHQRHEKPLNDQDYEQLAGCLRDNNLLDELHSLFADEAWLQARLAHDGYEYDGYIHDLEVGWQAAEAILHTQIGTDNQLPTVFFQVLRYGLLRTSINSLSATYSIPLIARAVELGVWTPSRALSAARKLTFPYYKTKLLGAILDITSLPDTDRRAFIEYALQTFAEIQHGYLDNLYAPLVAHLHGADLDRAIDLVIISEPDSERRRVLELLGAQSKGDPVRTERVMNAYLDTCRAEFDRQMGAIPHAVPHMEFWLAMTIPWLHENALHAAYEQALSTDFDSLGISFLLLNLLIRLDSPRREHIAARLVEYIQQAKRPHLKTIYEALPHLSPEERQTVLSHLHPLILDVLQRQTTDHNFVDARDFIPEYEGEPLNALLEAVNQRGNLWDRASTLISLLPKLTSDEERVVSLNRLFDMTEAAQEERLTGFITLLTGRMLVGELLTRALTAVTNIQNRSERTEALLRLLPYLEPADQESVRSRLLEETISKNELQVLARLIPLVPDDELQPLLELALDIDDPIQRNWLLDPMALRLNSEQVRYAFDRLIIIPDGVEQGFSLLGMLPYLRPEQIDRAIEVLLSVQHRSSMNIGHGLAGWLRRLDEPRFQRVLEYILSIEWNGNTLQTFGQELSERLSPSDIPRVFEHFMAHKNPWAVTAILRHLAPRLSAPLIQQTLQRIEQMADTRAKFELIQILCPYLPAVQREQVVYNALDYIEALNDDFQVQTHLEPIIPCLNTDQFDRAFKIANRSVYYQGQHWMNLAKHVPPERVESFLALALAHEHEVYGARMMAGIATQLSGDLLARALAGAKAIKGPYQRDCLVSLVAPFRKEHSQDETFELIHSMPDIHWQMDALSSVMPLLDEAGLERARLLIAGFKQEEYDHHASRALLNLLKVTSTPLRERVIDDLLNIPLRGDMLFYENFWPTVIQHLPASRITRAVTYAQAIAEDATRASALTLLLPLVSDPDPLVRNIRHSISAALRSLASEERKRILLLCANARLFAPPIMDETLIQQVADQILAICQDWTWI